MPLMPLAAFKAYDGSLDPFTLTQAVRLVQMRQEVSAAKMKVGYPGVHHVPTAEELKWKLEEFPLCERKPVSIDGYYDMKTETIGYVEACSDKKPILFVGESIAEMMAENPADFEQTTEMEKVSPGTWRSVVPLALRYFRFKDSVGSVRFLESLDPSFSVRGSFFHPDARLVEMWNASARTLHLCTRHFIIDGVKRDRLPWAGDLSVSLMANAYTSGDPSVVRRSLAVLETFKPTESDVNGLLDYSLWLVISHDLYQLYYGDIEFLRTQYPSIKCRLDTFISRADSDGLLRDDGWKGNSKPFVDWTEEVRRNVGDGTIASINMVYKGALDAGARLAERVGEREDAERWRMRAQAVKEACRKRWLDPKTRLFGPLRYANFYAVEFGVAEDSEHESIGNALAGDAMPEVGTPYCAYWQNAALVKCGRADAAMANVRRIWGGMLDDGATTFWEGWSAGSRGVEKYEFYKRPFAKSLCHAWSASPSFFFAREIAGIRPLTDGWKTWCKNPLPEASGMEFSIPVPGGRTIKVSFRQNQQVAY